MSALRKRVVVTLGLLLIASLVFAQALPNPNFNNRLRNELVAASQRAGVQIQVDQMVSLLRNRSALIAAPIRGFERVGAVDLPNGVDMAFTYVKSLGGKIPAGYYTIRGFVDDPQLGTNEARIQFIDQKGLVAGEIPGEVEIHSMTVPNPDPVKKVTLMAMTVMQGHFKAEGDALWVFCSNGQSWHFIEVQDQ